MRLWGFDIRRAEPEAKDNQFETVLQRIVAAANGGSVDSINPENCMQSPTVQAIVQAVARRISVSPVHVYQKGASKGLETKEKIPSHPVARLLSMPNSWQTRTSYWYDAASTFVRHGNFYAFKSRGSTGPIRELLPMHARSVAVKQDPQTWRVSYRYASDAGEAEYTQGQVHHVRGPARNFLKGDSPVSDVRMAIAMEIAAERFGWSFFENGAIPLLILQYAQGNKGFKDAEAERSFIESFQAAFGGKKRHTSFLLPKGIEQGGTMAVENDKAQFLETRKYQRTVIAGAFGVPPHLVGDLERATFNNVEQQDSDFTLNVVMPIAQAFESAMERDLLTPEDRSGGVIIRFNLDSILRADFKSRQEGLQVQRLNGVLSANEWREIEGKNPLSDDDGGNDYMYPGNMLVAGEEPEESEPPEPKPAMEEANDKARETLSLVRSS